MLKDIQPSDIEDITERFLSLFQDNKDFDTVKRINLGGDVPMFVIAIVEHESKFNYHMIADVITILLTRINVPKDEIDAVTEKV